MDDPIPKASEVDPRQVSMDSADRLRSALAAHGLTLPSLGVDMASGYVQLVSLGRCRPDVADKLSQILEKAKEC
jgi:hypothetical protein